MLGEAMTTTLLTSRAGVDRLDFDQIRDMNSFWDWLQGPFLEGAYTDPDVTGEHTGGDGWQGPGWMYGNNHIIGAIRLRQLRVVKSTDVSSSFGANVQWKWPIWSESSQDTAPYGPSDVYTYAATTDGIMDHFSGRYDYPGNGYSVLLDSKLNRTQANSVLAEMKTNQWTGAATRLVTVDINVYNPNIELFCISRLGIEFLPSGRVYASAVLMPAVLTRYEKTGGYLWAVIEFILYAYVLVLTGRMVLEMYGIGLAAFFSGPLNWVEFINQLTFMLVFCLRISQEAMIAPKYSSLGHSGGEAVDLFAVAYIERTIDNVMAFNAVFMYMRLLKFLSINPNVGKLVHIFTVAIRALLYLLLIVFILLFAYALAFHLLFRTSYPEFATMGAALMTVIRSVLGDFPIIELEGTNAVLARLLFITYMVVLFFIVLNMFIAVLAEV